MATTDPAWMDIEISAVTEEAARRLLYSDKISGVAWFDEPLPPDSETAFSIFIQDDIPDECFLLRNALMNFDLMVLADIANRLQRPNWVTMPRSFHTGWNIHYELWTFRLWVEKHQNDKKFHG